MFWRKLLNLIFYSNLWIALAAAAMVMQTQYLLTLRWEWTTYTSFVFTATLCLYALHRLVAVRKVAPFREQGRFQVIWQYRTHIVWYAAAAGLASLYFFVQLPMRLWVQLWIPCVIALLYVLPAFGKGRRLRDLNYIKIFLVAITWTWLTAILPATLAGRWLSLPALLLALERVFFIFAITVPFDIRDLQIDAHTRVHTLPGRFGTRAAKRMAYVSLALMLLAAFANVYIDAYPLPVFSVLSGVAVLSAFCVAYSDQTDKDYFFTGLIDGTMILQCVLIAGMSQLG